MLSMSADVEDLQIVSNSNPVIVENICTAAF